MGFFDSFWNIVSVFFWTFAFIAYLMALFSVIGDLFRDHTIAGGYKAIWIIFLVFIPFLTVLAYLIFRGRGMAERQAANVKQAQTAADNYIKTVAGLSPSDEIVKAKSLLDSGAINQQEFDSLKAHALSVTPSV
ncbi:MULTISPECIES: SHOCT domain-containing protein [Subtercola]|nr:MULTISPECIES: SHOCT domain-containing protein [Subtercola]MEA9986577.1 PLDc N-terminal domain-containing protein [Subtercola sp. RTI3]